MAKKSVKSAPEAQAQATSLDQPAAEGELLQKPEAPNVEVIDIAALTPLTEEQNNNMGNERGDYLLGVSMERNGVGRGIVTDKALGVIGGNHVTNKFAQMGFKRVVTVDSDGDTLVVTRRRDIEPGSLEAEELAVADNRVGEVNLTWNYDNIMQDGSAERRENLIEPYWQEHEIEMNFSDGWGDLPDSPDDGHDNEDNRFDTTLVRMRIKMEQEHQVRTVVGNALMDAGIEYEFI